MSFKEEMASAHRRIAELESIVEEKKQAQLEPEKTQSACEESFTQAEAGLREARNLAMAKYADLKNKVSNLMRFKKAVSEVVLDSGEDVKHHFGVSCASSE